MSIVFRNNLWIPGSRCARPGMTRDVYDARYLLSRTTSTEHGA
ncbi:hypothetical protein SAMN05444123_107222 [Rhodopseudomonas pseudopalustris]|uniref:Uncharacterized protein n=1 Tax=Rhodopseudomonas pseudopalustris TaxID=1513892 RepID=A0A1H8USN7_9BRAD|nr:hypothetical protein SAMN05444123_107222 [Rhodopseudomonas pseudopalustris]